MSPFDDVASLGYWLRRRRKALDLTQAKLAQQVGCAVATIKKIEGDERRPSQAMAERLADCLAIPSEDRAAFLRVARAESALHRLVTVAPVAAPACPGPVVTATAPPPNRQPHNLPVATNRLVGRRQEVAAIQALLQRSDLGLLTLTGPGGIGKTRLALQVAHELVAALSLECWFVDLAPVPTAALVLPTIAQTLGVNTPAHQSVLDSLKPYLHSRQVLLLLDNFEHVLAAATHISALLAFAPGLKVLVTSRAVLHLAGEYEFSVPPLALPDQVDPTDLTALAQYESVELLLERAQAKGASLSLTPENAVAIAQICRRLDGLPLALELAAARCRLFAPADLLTRLAYRLVFLTAGPHDQPLRQQTLRATLDWSYQLLQAEEQTLFARLGVFVGGFTVAAAEAVSQAVDVAQMNVVEALTALLDQSLLGQMVATAGERRFTMLETIREYALEKLVERGEEAALRDRHAAYFLQLAEQVRPLLYSAQQHILYQRLILEQSNFRAALQWAYANHNYAQVARFGAALCWFWTKYGELREEMPRLEWALREIERQRATTLPALQAKALYSVAQGALWFGDFSRARRLFEECLQIEEELDSWFELSEILGPLAEILEWEGDYPRATVLAERYLALSRAHNFTQGVADALTSLGELLRLQGDYVRACQLLQESLALRKVVGTLLGVASTQGYLGIATRELGDFLEAQRLQEEALQLATTLGDKMLIAGITTELGVVAHLLHDYERAYQRQQRALTLLTELDFQAYVALALSRLGSLALSQAAGDKAHAYYVESLALAQRIGSKRSLTAALEGLAALAALNGQPTQAAHLLGTADATRASIGIARPIEERILYEQTVALVRTALGEAQFDEACLIGQAAPLNDVLTLFTQSPVPGL